MPSWGRTARARPPWPLSYIASVIGFDSGTVEVYGRQPARARSLMGYVPQDSFSSALLTGRENLRYFSGLLGFSGDNARQAVEEMLREIGLSAEADKRVSHYSGGMRRRLEIATAPFPQIRMMVLDEPTSGLDPAARREFFSLIQDIRGRKATILFITHIGSDAELASKVGFIDGGKIIAEGSPDSLRACYPIEGVIKVETAVRDARIASLLQGFSSREIAETDTGYRVYAREVEQIIPEIFRSLGQAGYRADKIEQTSPTLEDVFLKLTEHSIQEVRNK